MKKSENAMDFNDISVGVVHYNMEAYGEKYHYNTNVPMWRTCLFAVHQHYA